MFTLAIYIFFGKMSIPLLIFKLSILVYLLLNYKIYVF